jgi:RNA polymerase sigma-70 factor, ECF subfamily
MAAASDRDLVDRARGGDAEAFGLLVRRHQKRIFRLAVHLTKSATEAEDITQDTFVRAYQALSRFDGRSEPFTWLYRIAVNLSLNHLRQRKSRKVDHSDDDPRIAAMLSETRPGMQADPASAADQRKLAEALCAGVDALSETLRTTLVLVSIDGLSHEQAAEVLGCPVGTIAWRVHEARRKLRVTLAERGFGTGEGDA